MNKGQVAVTLPAPYGQTVASGSSVVLTEDVPVVTRRLAGLLGTLSLSVGVASSASVAASAPTATTTETPTQATYSATYQTRITNISTSAAQLPSPYFTVVGAGQSTIVTDSVPVVAANLGETNIWQISVVDPTSPAAVVTYGPLDLHGQRAINAAAPVATTDLATKGYVDAAIAAAPATTSVTMGGDVLGQSNAATVAKLQGRAVASTAPASGQVLGWDGTTWKPINQSGGGGGATTVTLPTAATLNPGECVAVDPATGNAVRAKPTEPQKMPAIGIVQSATPEEVVVQLNGTKAGYLGLTPGTVYFVSRSGAPDASLPGPGAQIQIIGVAVSATTMIVNPSFPTVQRSA